VLLPGSIIPSVRGVTGYFDLVPSWIATPYGLTLEFRRLAFLDRWPLRAARSLCSRVAWLERGELRREGRADEVVEAYRKEAQS
jgi:hypothetical protein